MDEVFWQVYKEIKREWNKLRQTNVDEEILKFLIHLMELMENVDEEA